MKSLWPWMKDVDVALVTEPISHVNEYDQRVAVRDVIDDYRQSIYEVRVQLQKHDLYHSRKHDDLWIVRFLLSHSSGAAKKKKNVKHAVDAAIRSMEYRDKYQLDVEDIRAYPANSNCPKSDALRRYMEYVDDDALQFVVPDRQRGVIGFLKFSGFQQQELVNNVKEEDWIPSFSYFTEWSHQWLDYITRTTGRLTKSIRIVDTRNMSLLKINHEMNRRDGETMKYMEDFYPQLLHGIYICHPPPWIQIPWRMVRVILPKRLRDKIDFINPESNIKERTRLFQHISKDHLPIQFGGTNTAWPVEFTPAPVK